MLLEHPALLGLGIDEGTAIDVGPDQRFEVLGCGAVMVLDARRAAPPRLGPQGHLAATDLRVHLLVAGDRFDLTRGRPIVARPP